MPQVLLFAAAREAAETSSYEAAEGPLQQLLDDASKRFGPRFAQVLDRCAVVVGERSWDPATIDSSVLVGAGDTVAILPPVSGGDHTEIRMIDVADKAETARSASATCTISMQPHVRELVMSGSLRKGDAIATAVVAGIMAAKRVPDAIPLCHPVRTTGVDVLCTPEDDNAIVVLAHVRGRDRTGFEIEALAAASTAALTIYDMAKGDDPAMRIDGLRVIAKSGGVGGDWTSA